MSESHDAPALQDSTVDISNPDGSKTRLLPNVKVALSQYFSIAMVRFDFEVFGNPERSRFFGMDFGNEALSKS